MIYLGCKFFHEPWTAIGLKDCCQECHSYAHQSGLTYIHPFKESYPNDINPDWELGVSAHVCCSLTHFVRGLSREWWIAHKVESPLAHKVESPKRAHKGSSQSCGCDPNANWLCERHTKRQEESLEDEVLREFRERR